MGRLFWKIFLGFWLTMLLTNVGIAWVMAQFLLLSDDQPTRRLDPKSRHQMMTVVSVLEYGGITATKAMLTQRLEMGRFKILVINEQGQELLDRSHGNQTKEKVKESIANSDQYPKNGFVRKVFSAEGEPFTIIAEPRQQTIFSVFNQLQRRENFLPPPRHLRPPPQQARKLLFIRLGLMIPISGLFCFWLAWYLTKPVRQLREATQQLANGDLGVRVASLIGRRRDEIADLGHDFDHMAEQLQLMIFRQKQLIQDISHELRSPLARLQVAMGLTRKKIGTEAEHELGRIEREANRLESLVAQVLSLAKLEESNVYALEEYIDIAGLLQTIVTDADYEAVSRHCHVKLNCKIRPILKANGELLHRALENIIRNAVYYTAKQTTVTIVLQEKKGGQINILVLDCGEGVPPEQLTELFEPFVRMAKSRDRDSGGYGLGLAIAKRAIQLHKGEVFAYNRESRGLCVEINLPFVDLTV
jgi:signal transduction histidine kinase